MRDTPMSRRGEDRGEARDASVVLPVKCKLHLELGHFMQA